MKCIIYGSHPAEIEGGSSRIFQIRESLGLLCRLTTVDVPLWKCGATRRVLRGTNEGKLMQRVRLRTATTLQVESHIVFERWMAFLFNTKFPLFMLNPAV